MAGDCQAAEPPVTMYCSARRPEAAKHSRPLCGRSIDCSSRRGRFAQRRGSVLYVSPLKALANDIRLNLEEPLAGVDEAARAAGLKLAPIRAGLRTGDTPVARTWRDAAPAAAHPRHHARIAVYPADLGAISREARAVRYVIVDELHAVAGNKRGAHLALRLSGSNGWSAVTGCHGPCESDYLRR